MLLTAAVLGVYGQAGSFEFVTWDDPAHLFENPLYNPLDAGNFGRIWTRPYFGLFAPVSYTVWAGATLASRALFGTPFDPRVYHALNLALHLGVVWLAWGLLRRLGAGVAPATAAALLFALHPMQVEVVAWVSEARGLLAALFSLIALHLYLRGYGAAVTRDSIDGALRPIQTPSPHAGRWHLAATAALLAALLSKPSAVVLPVVVVALEITLWGTAWRRSLARVGDWLALCVGWSYLCSRVQPATVLSEIVPLWQRPAVAADALAFYLQKLCWPVGLCAEYGRTPTTALAQPAWTWCVVAATLVIAALTVLLAWRWLAPAAALLATPLLPVLGFLPFHYQELSTVADRYLYLGMLGPALALAWWLERRGGMARWLATCAALAALAFVSHQRTADWQDSVTLWNRALSINPNSSAAHVNLGVVLQRRGDLDGAEKHFRQAAAVKPTLAQAHLGLGDVATERQRREAARDHYRQAVECDPRSIRAQTSLANALLSLDDRPGAIDAYRQTLQIDPRQPSAANFLARLLATQDKGRTGAAVEALQWAQHACALTGHADHFSLDTLAAAHAQAEDYGQALRWLDQAEAVAKARGDEKYLTQSPRRRAQYQRRQPLRERQLYVE